MTNVFDINGIPAVYVCGFCSSPQPHIRTATGLASEHLLPWGGPCPAAGHPVRLAEVVRNEDGSVELCPAQQSAGTPPWQSGIDAYHNAFPRRTT